MFRACLGRNSQGVLTSLARDDNQPPAPRVKRRAQRCRQKQKRREEALNLACCQPGKTEIGHQCFFIKKTLKKNNLLAKLRQKAKLEIKIRKKRVNFWRFSVAESEGKTSFKSPDSYNKFSIV